MFILQTTLLFLVPEKVETIKVTKGRVLYHFVYLNLEAKIRRDFNFPSSSYKNYIFFNDTT
ncbi:hypothetical protein CK934_11495 [Chitinophaga sp. MD30]|nr:hypothetical protein CK934_11495 [Chitinophaga sp. MD30]